MITPKLQQLINQYQAELPSYHQEVLGAFNWLVICEEIAAKYRMSERQSELFIAEVVMMLYQITSADLFKINLMNHVGISEASAHNIILDVKSRILDRLQFELEKVVGETPQIMQTELEKAGIAAPVAQDFVSNADMIAGQQLTVPSDQANDPYHEAID